MPQKSFNKPFDFYCIKQIDNIFPCVYCKRSQKTSQRVKNNSHATRLRLVSYFLVLYTLWRYLDGQTSELGLKVDLNECEHFLKKNWDYLNECEHFLKENWDWSKRVWTLSQSELLEWAEGNMDGSTKLFPLIWVGHRIFLAQMDRLYGTNIPDFLEWK